MIWRPEAGTSAEGAGFWTPGTFFHSLSMFLTYRKVSDLRSEMRPSSSQDDLDTQIGNTSEVAGKARTIRPPRALPSSRAAVGGLLVAVAAIGTWAASSNGDAGPTERYVVASRPVAAGVALERSDLAFVTVDLPDRLRSAAFDDPDELVGAVTRGPLSGGDLIQAGSVSTGGASVGEAELSFSVDPHWAVAGEISVGDRVAVYATDEEGVTELVLNGVDVLSVTSADDDGLASDGTQTVVVAAADTVVARAVAATRTAEITVVRVNAPAPSTDGERSIKRSDPNGSTPGRTKASSPSDSIRKKGR